MCLPLARVLCAFACGKGKCVGENVKGAAAGICLSTPFFGNSSVRRFTWAVFCVPASQRICLCRKVQLKTLPFLTPSQSARGEKILVGPPGKLERLQYVLF